MVAAGILVDPRRPAKLTPGDDTHILVEAAVVEIADERRDRLIEAGELVGESGEVGMVAVPAAKRERHAPHPRLDEAPGDEELIHPVGPGILAEGRVGRAAAVAIARGGVFPFHVEALDEPARGQHIKRLRCVGIVAGGGGSVAPAAKAIDPLDEAAPVAELVERDTREPHAREPLVVGLAGGVGGAEEAGEAGIAVGSVAGLDREANKRRHGPVDGAMKAREGGAERRMAILPAARADRIARQAQIGAMLIEAAMERANDGKLFHHRCEARQMFADLDAGDARGDRPKAPADLGWGLHLQVEHVLVRRAPRQIDHDHGLVAEAPGSCAAGGAQGLGGHQPRHRQPAEGEPANLQGMAPRAAPRVVTKSLDRPTGDHEHGIGHGGAPQRDHGPKLIFTRRTRGMRRAIGWRSVRCTIQTLKTPERSASCPSMNMSVESATRALNCSSAATTRPSAPTATARSSTSC